MVLVRAFCVEVGNKTFSGFHSLQCKISVAKSATGSEMHPHSLGHGLPPNVSRSAINRKMTLLMTACVNDFVAVAALKCWRRYADFQSIFDIQIRVVG